MADPVTVDVRELAACLIEDVELARPGSTRSGDPQTIRTAANPMLATLRAVNHLLKEMGIDTTRAVRRGKIDSSSQSLEAMLTPKTARPALEDGKLSLRELMHAVDRRLMDVVRRGGMPRWFVDEYYPALCARLARGERATDRDLNILSIVLDEVPVGSAF